MEIDYSGIVYNIEGIPEEENVIERFPDLMQFAHIFMKEDVPDGVSTDKVLRYLIYMFSPGSPLRDSFPDVSHRKRYVLNKLNIDLNEEGKLPEGYNQMALMSEDWICDRFVVFTHLFKSEDYSMMATAEVRMAAMQRAIISLKIDKSGDDKNFQEGLERWRKSMVEARNRIMEGEKSKKLQETITFSIKTDSLGIQPEEAAKYWRDFGEIFEEVIP